MTRRACGLAMPVIGLLLAAAVLLTWAEPAAAQQWTRPQLPGSPLEDALRNAEISIEQIDELYKTFEEATESIGGRLKEIATNLLFSLLLIEMVWTLGQIVMRGGDFGRLMSEVFQRIVIAGLFLFLIDGIPTPQGKLDIAAFILRSAEALAGVTVEAEITPAKVFGEMYKIGANAYFNTSGFVRSIVAGIVWLVLMFLGAIITGMMLVAYIHIYMAFTVGILTLGFGVWKQTSNIARNFLFTAAGKIFRLFTVLLIVTVIRLQIEEMKAVATLEDGILMIGMCLIFLMVLSSVPGQVESIVAGGSGPAAEDKVAGAATYAPREAAKRTVGAGLSAAGGGVRAGTAAAYGGVSNRAAALLRSLQRG